MDTPAPNSAAAAESPVTQSSQDAAIALLRGASADPPAAPTDTPTESSPAPTDAPPPPPIAAPPVAPQDDDAALLAILEERKAKRTASTAPDVVAQLQAKIDALEARLAQPPAPAHHDYAALVREHGRVKAMQILGLDPLAEFHAFKEEAKDPASIQRARAEAERQKQLDEIRERQEQVGKTIEQWQAEQQAKATAAAWNGYVELARTADPILSKLPADKIVEATNRKMAEIDAQYGVEVRQSLTDAQLAKLVAKDYRALKALLAEIDLSGSTTPQVPANDGARQPATATLSNDLASQASGQTRPLNEEERVEEAIKLLKRAQS